MLSMRPVVREVTAVISSRKAVPTGSCENIEVDKHPL